MVKANICLLDELVCKNRVVELQDETETTVIVELFEALCRERLHVVDVE